jgi:hypothetical protein
LEYLADHPGELDGFGPVDCRDRPKDSRGEHRWRMGLPGHRQRPGSSHRNPGSAPYRSAETADPG